MATSGIHRNSATRTARKIEVPRPLKDSSLNELTQKSSFSPLALSSYSIDCVEKLIALMDMVVNSINQCDDSNANIEPSLLTENIIHLCKHLKIYGPQLENSIYQGQLDRAFLSFREGLVRGVLEYEARVHLLDILELCESNWIPRKNLSPVTNNNPTLLSSSYQEFGDYSDFPSSYPPTSSCDSPTSLGPDEVVKRFGKLRDKAPKSGLKSYNRNEVIIRNSDSGKVMGIRGRRVHMIEQLSETVISFQRVPTTAKERVVQITGPSEEKISYATRLIENTIRNNTSPAREMFESESSCSSEDSNGYSDFGNQKSVDQAYLYKHKVIVRNCHLTITGDDYTYVTVAKAILDDYFSRLRASESPDDVSLSDDVFVDDRLLKNEDSKKPGLSNSNSALGRSNLKSHPETSDFTNNSNRLDSTNSPFPQDSYNLPEKLSFNSWSKEIPPLGSAFENVRCDMTSAINPNDFVTAESSTARNIYTKEFLLSCQESELSQRKPDDWEIITLKFPQIIRGQEDDSDVIIIEE